MGIIGRLFGKKDQPAAKPPKGPKSSATANGAGAALAAHSRDAGTSAKSGQNARATQKSS